MKKSHTVQTLRRRARLHTECLRKYHVKKFLNQYSCVLHCILYLHYFLASSHIFNPLIKVFKNLVTYIFSWNWDMVVSTVARLWAGLSRVKFLGRCTDFLLPNVQTSSCSYSASCSAGHFTMHPACLLITGND